jgi:hypothetical protein
MGFVVRGGNILNYKENRSVSRHACYGNLDIARVCCAASSGRVVFSVYVEPHLPLPSLSFQVRIAASFIASQPWGHSC